MTLGVEALPPTNSRPKTMSPIMSIWSVRFAVPTHTRRLGGPALASPKSPLADALMDAASQGQVPLDFLSWHLYDNDPRNFWKTIDYMKAKLAKYKQLSQVETIIDEWNMSLDNPILNPYFQPAFVLETTLGFSKKGLSRSSYYHIRDYLVDPAQFSRFMSPSDTAFMAHWWNEMPQYVRVER